MINSKTTHILILFLLLLSLLTFSQKKDSLISILETDIHDTTRIAVLLELSDVMQARDIDSSIIITKNTARFCNRILQRYVGEMLFLIQKKKSQCFYDLGGLYAAKGDSANQLFYLRKCQDLRVTLRDSLGLIDVYISEGVFYSEHGNYSKALHCLEKGLKTSERINYPKGVAQVYNNIGYVQNNTGKIDKGLESYYKALLIQEEIYDLEGAASTLNNIAFVYYQQENFDKALEYWLKSLDYRIQTKNKVSISHSLNNLGSVYYQLGDVTKALSYFEKSYKIQIEMGDKQASAYSLNNIGFIYNQQKDYKNAKTYWENCLEIRQDINDKKGQIYSLQNLSALYLAIHNYDKALSLAKKSVVMSKSIGIVNLEKTSYHRIYKVYLKLKEYKNALLYFTKYVALKDSLNNGQNSSFLAERDAKYKYYVRQIADSISYVEELRLKDINISKQKAIVQKQKILQYALFLGIMFVFIILVLVYRMLKMKRKANRRLHIQKSEIVDQAQELFTQNEEIQAQRDKIEFHKSRIENIHLNIKDSITYAKNIQNVMFPQEFILKNNFSEFFVFFKPKDIVSGDFFWWEKINNNTVITAVDCTGHGVPGAFMSMLGISFLREIVNKEYITDTGLILQKLRKEVVKSLRQTSKMGKQIDGMDMAIVSVNHETNVLQFSGANNPLYIIRKKNMKPPFELTDAIRVFDILESDYILYEVKPDKMPIAIYERMDKFSTHEFQLEKDDQFYMFSDGYTDQFGGPRGRKFMKKSLKRLLLENANKPMHEQREVLQNVLEEWMGVKDQVDDILLIGVKV